MYGQRSFHQTRRVKSGQKGGLDVTAVDPQVVAAQSLSLNKTDPVPQQRELRRGDAAPPVRTLVDILLATADRYPTAAAVDDGGEDVGATGPLSYRETVAEAERMAARLTEAGVRRGDRVGIRLSSGTRDLYLSILGTLFAGAAYVPVDADDPPERAELVFGEADVAVVVTDGPTITPQRALPSGGHDPQKPRPEDDAWVIFTSGSTGVPKGVAVTHRNAAAFVDAEAGMFLQDAPLSPDDRVLAGLSVAFDASCEEMWLAWRNGSCLVPAPRALVRTGMDLGPWLVDRDITVVSTVPTLASLWPAESLAAVRLLIFGGEACPPELVERLVAGGREVWNTYGPTEATVVACGALLDGEGSVPIGLPLAGWDLAVVGEDQQPVPPGESGELIIGGVGLARYLDPVKDAEKYAPMPSLGWERAYRSGDLVRYEPEGLLFLGRADEQVKLGGRRIELGEIDAALQGLPGIAAAAAAVKNTRGGSQVLVGYLVPVESQTHEYDLSAALELLRAELPAALVPLLAVVDELPTRISGKVDRHALPWPIAGGAPGSYDSLGHTEAWLAGLWEDILGASGLDEASDFFAFGGSSLSSARLVSRLRERYPEATVAMIYAAPKLGDLARSLEALAPAAVPFERTVRPVPRSAQWVQTLLTIPLNTFAGLRWLTWMAAISNVVDAVGHFEFVHTVSWWWILAGWFVFLSPIGRMGLTVIGARLLLRGITPGSYPRGGKVHLRVWTAERFAEAVGAASLAGAPWIVYYARALGAKVGPGVDLHSLPPITGMIHLGRGCSIEPEVDLAGHWLDGDILRLGTISVGAGATVGARSTLGPGTAIGPRAVIEPGSAVVGKVPAEQAWAGSPAHRVIRVKDDWPTERPPRRPAWIAAYGAVSSLLAILPVLAFAAGAAVAGWWIGASRPDDRGVDVVGFTLGDLSAALVAVPLITLTALLAYALLTLLAVRLLGIGLRAGFFPVRSRIGWQVWATERLMDDARTLLFPLYSSLATPGWLRALGATIGSGVEASTVLMIPKMTTVGDGAFLADDTMVGSYELAGGWMRIRRAKVGKRAFLGNSGMTGGGRRVPNDGLVAVLSAAPDRAKKGTSWIGSPPVQLQRQATSGDVSRTFDPPTKVKVARALVELCRLIPVMVTVAIGLGVLLTLAELVNSWGFLGAALLSGFVLLAAGGVAGVISSAAKWLLVGRIRVGEHPLWSSFVWRNEVADTFVETVAAPWFARAASGTPVLNLWLRSLGAKIGRGVWCETYWLPEADLIELGDGASVNPGCVLQTHLFHDRIMAMDTVILEPGATLGPHSVILPAASIGASSTVGPASLVMRGETVPAGTRWRGNPIAPEVLSAKKWAKLAAEVPGTSVIPTTLQP